MNKNNAIRVTLLMIGWGNAQTNDQTDDRHDHAAYSEPWD